MRHRTVAHGDTRTIVAIFDNGDEVVDGLSALAREHELSAAGFTAIGAFSDAVVAWFDWEAKEYREIPVDEQVEVLTLAGDVALNDGEPAVHAHVVLGKRDGTAHGGHLMRAHVRPTLEVVLTETPEHLRKSHDPESGLALIDL